MVVYTAVPVRYEKKKSNLSEKYMCPRVYYWKEHFQNTLVFCVEKSMNVFCKSAGVYIGTISSKIRPVALNSEQRID